MPDAHPQGKRSEQSASDRYAAIRHALALGYPDLADAINDERTCPDCGGYVTDDGWSVDPDKCCARCEP